MCDALSAASAIPPRTAPHRTAPHAIPPQPEPAQLGTREKDLRRLHTAGFVTEFGGVSDSDTGRAEVRYVAEKLDQVRSRLARHGTARPARHGTAGTARPARHCTARHEAARHGRRGTAGAARPARHGDASARGSACA
jgi:hypothetical protein